MRKNNHQAEPETDWYSISNHGEIISPSLLIYPDRIESNILKMIETASGPQMLRPHVKTHKMAEIVRLQIRHGIRKFKCATIAEAEMTASEGAEDILLAYQPVGPNLRRFFELKKNFPFTAFSCITDCMDIAAKLSELSARSGMKTNVWIDLNVGMNRTGVAPGEPAVTLFRRINLLPGLVPSGFHAYDGHIHESDLTQRKKKCDESFENVLSTMTAVSLFYKGPLKVIAGGTPTFPIHSGRRSVELSPGTTLLWDYGYSTTFSDMDYKHAAVLLARVISKPCEDLICIDLGHKAVASEMPPPRVKLCGLDSYDFVSHNEEHMVFRIKNNVKINVGDVIYCIPWHICPTVDRHDKAWIVNGGKVTGYWDIKARKRQINI